MKTFKTAKGTELPIMDIKGKDYLQAAPRIFWLKEEHPDWSIETEFLTLSTDVAVCKATIKDGNGRVLATATSMETPKGFDSFVEKAETCAISRAASFCGYGTLMAQELEEQGKLAETPLAPKGSQTLQEQFASPAQVSRLMAIAKANGVAVERLKEISLEMGIKSSTEIPRSKYEELCNAVGAK